MDRAILKCVLSVIVGVGFTFAKPAQINIQESLRFINLTCKEHEHHQRYFAFDPESKMLIAHSGQPYCTIEVPMRQIKEVYVERKNRTNFYVTFENQAQYEPSIKALCKQYQGNENIMSITVSDKHIADTLAFEFNKLRSWCLATMRNHPTKIIISRLSPDRGFVKAKILKIALEGRVVDEDGIAQLTLDRSLIPFEKDGSFQTDLMIADTQRTIIIEVLDSLHNLTFRNIPIHDIQLTSQIYTEPYKKTRRIALLIGNKDYQHGSVLRNPINDVRAMAALLSGLDFTVMKYENCSQKEMKKAINLFGSRLDSFDVSLFFYAGHGLQVDGLNYLVPIDAQLLNENDVEYDCIQANRVASKFEHVSTSTNIMILDACRDNPFERSWKRGTRGNGLAFMNAPSGSLIAYSTSPGRTASDGDGSNGLYTEALLEYIAQSGLTVEDVFKRVRLQVMQKSNNRQIPWESTSLLGDFYFKPAFKERTNQ